MDLLLIVLVIVAVLAIAGGFFVSPLIWIVILACVVIFAVTRSRGSRL